MSYSLYSPLVPRIRVLDASGQPVATARVSAPVYQSETKYAEHDASVAVEMSLGEYYLEIQGRLLTRLTIRPARGFGSRPLW